MSKLKKIHDEINKMDIRSNILKSATNYCKDNNIVIIYGASDDLIEFEGAVYDEMGAYDGFDYEDIDEEFINESGIDSELLDLAVRLELVAKWCPDDEKSWEVKINDKFEKMPFDIIEDGEVFCRGVIVQL